jgi:GABA(A) receptor-associated protein
MSEFKKNHTFKQQQDEANRILKKYPDRIPIIIEKNSTCTSIPNLDKNKYLVPKQITIGQLIQIVRKRIKIKPEQALFCFIGNVIPSSSETVEKIYHNYKEESGFLFVTVSSENTFG